MSQWYLVHHSKIAPLPLLLFISCKKRVWDINRIVLTFWLFSILYTVFFPWAKKYVLIYICMPYPVIAFMKSQNQTSKVSFFSLFLQPCTTPVLKPTTQQKSEYESIKRKGKLVQIYSPPPKKKEKKNSNPMSFSVISNNIWLKMTFGYYSAIKFPKRKI